MRHFALFAYGFRPFFLLAALYAVLATASWLAAFYGHVDPLGVSTSTHWHAHEMLYGFVAAAIAGFLLTAVPSWTGRRGFAGFPLALLVLIWLAGRIAMLPALNLEPGVVTTADLMFLPAVVAAITPSLVRSGNVRNWPMVAILVILFLANVLFHVPTLASRVGVSGFVVAINTVLVLVTLIGGRIVPAFTGNALRREGRRIPLPGFGVADRATLVGTLAVWAIDIVAWGSSIAGITALAAGVLHAWRLSRWRGWSVRGVPIVWILHLGYGWIPLALVLKGSWLLWDLGVAAGWMHGLTAGGFATMIVAVMTRAALGHTGRALVAPRLAVACYWLLNLGAVLRVFGHVLVPSLAVPVAGVLWIFAFVLFLIAYTPILCLSRVDGRPG